MTFFLRTKKLTPRSHTATKREKYYLSIVLIVFFLSACSQDGKSINAVKAHSLDLIGSTTVSQALDDRPGCASVEWSTKTDAAGRTIVDYRCLVHLEVDPFGSFREQEAQWALNSAQVSINQVQQTIEREQRFNAKSASGQQEDLARAARNLEMQQADALEFGDLHGMLLGIRDKLQSPESSLEEKTLELASLSSELSLLQVSRHVRARLLRNILAIEAFIPSFERYWKGSASPSQIARLNAWVNENLDDHINRLDIEIRRIEEEARRQFDERISLAESKVLEAQRAIEQREAVLNQQAERHTSSLRDAERHFASVEARAELEALNRWPRFDSLFHAYRWLMIDDQVHLIAEGYLAEHSEVGIVRLAGNVWFEDPTSNNIFSRIESMKPIAYGTNGIAARRNDSARDILDALLLRARLRKHGFPL